MGGLEVTMKISAFVFSIALLLTADVLRAQDTRSRWHNVRGIVVDEIGRPIATATVYLKDAGGHRLRMKQTDRGGRFSFGLVNTDNKYEIYAEQATLVSRQLPVPTVQSSHDLELKLVVTNKAAQH
jgi:Carboxypeptidase regulatory-like domain